jgi:hypothetical protein
VNTQIAPPAPPAVVRTRGRRHLSGTPSGGRALPQFDRDYWLAHCEGFRVDADAGRLGFVEEVRTDGRNGPVLAVRAGLLGRRLLLVPTSEVAFLVPRAERIWLRSPVTLIATEASP